MHRWGAADRALREKAAYRLVQKKSPLFEFPSFLPPTNSGQPMQSQSALTELPPPNLAPFLLLDPLLRDSAAQQPEEAASYDDDCEDQEEGAIGSMMR